MAEQEKSLIELLQEADNGDVKAMRDAIARLEIQGYDKEKDVDIIERIVKYKKAMADAGSTSGYIMLAEEYLEGKNVPKDVDKAIELYKQAADGGEDFGNQSLGMLYYEGKHVTQDYQKAMEYFTKEDGRKSACTTYSMAEMYRLGLGVEEDEEKAFELYKEIIDDDSPYAAYDDYYPRACFRLAQILHSFEDGEAIQQALKLVNYAKDSLLNRGNDAVATDITEEEVMEEWKSLMEDAENYEAEASSTDHSYHYNLENPWTGEKFEDEIIDAVMNLEVREDEPNDFIVVDFAYEQGGGVVFVQAALDDEGDNYDLELARYEDNLDEGEYAYEDDNGRKYKLYLREPYEDTDARTVIETLRRTMVEDDCPDLTTWRDITEVCIKGTEERARQAAENNQEEE